MNLGRAQWLGLAVIVGIGAWLRSEGLTFGFPLIVHPDEPRVADAALHILDDRTLHPGTLLYPSFLIYVNALVFDAVRTFWPGAPTIVDYYYWGRAATVLIAMCTVVVCARIATRLAGPVAGYSAAIFTTVSLLHAENSFLITTDVPTALWTTAAVGASLRLLERDRARMLDYLAAGALVGLAAGTKYNGVFVCVAVAAAHVLRNGIRPKTLLDPRLLAAGAVSAIAFFMTTPYALLDSAMFSEYIAIQRNAYTWDHFGNTSQGYSFGFYANALATKFSSAGLALAAVGLTAWFARSPRQAITLAIFPVVFFVFMGAYPVRFDRNIVPIVPMLGIAAGLGAAVLAELVAAAANKRNAEASATLRTWIRAMVIALVCVAALPQASAVRAHTARLTLPDTRVLAKSWIEENLRQGARIARDFYTAPLDTERFHVEAPGYFGLIQLQNLDSFDYLVASKGDFGRFFAQPERYAEQRKRYQAIFDRYRTVKRFVPFPKVTTGPEIRILSTRDTKPLADESP